jgi:hypothetical protein
MPGDLFSAGFAWDNVADVATPIATSLKPSPGTPARAMSQLPATPFATPDEPTFSGNFGWSDDDVASVADVAKIGGGQGESQNATPQVATSVATPEIADFEAFSIATSPRVADVASVANWTFAIERAARARAPSGMAELAWRGLLMDARLIVQNWGEDLISLGWSTVEVFGAPAQPEHRRIDVVGLAPMLRGRAVEAIDQDTALIRATPRDTMTFHRMQIAPGGVPFWDWVGVPSIASGAVRVAGMGKRLQRIPMSLRHVNTDHGGT